MARPRVAIAHDYLTQRGGAERVVLSIQKAFPEATIYTTLYDPDGTYPEFRESRIRASWLNRFAFFRRDHRKALPFLAFAARSLRIDADVVVASSSGWAHGFNICGRRLVYCHAPARWLYQSDTYLGGNPACSLRGLALLALRPALRAWDARNAHKADKYLTNSQVVRHRVAETYGITAEVLPAPHRFHPSLPTTPVVALEGWSDYYLVVSRLLPYKNVTSVVQAFHQMTDKRLVIVGDGPLRDQLAAALPANARLLSRLDDGQLRWVYQHCRALIAPSFEDYGLTPLEAGVFGKPTLALRAGGYLDTIAEGLSGRFFETADAASIAKAVTNDTDPWDAAAIVAHVDQFSEQHFIDRLREEVEALLGDAD